MNIKVSAITEDNKEVLALPNDPFLNTGRLIPIYDGEKWSYRIEEFADDCITEDCFPDENYIYEDMGQGFYGLAAEAGGCFAGYAVCYRKWNRYLLVDNLLVSSCFRRQGVGSALIRAALELAHSLGLLGIWLVCQDNNLGAAEFYLKNGFEIGGVDTRSYDGTKQEGKKDIFFYLALTK